MADKTSFSPMKALGIPPKDYDSFWKNDSFSADRGYSAKPNMVTPYDAYEEQFQREGTKNALQGLQDKREMTNPAFDPFSDEGQQKRAGYLMRGTLEPSQEYALERMEKPPAVNKYSPVQTEVVKAVAPLEVIDPTDPQAWAQMTKVLQDLDNHPELGGSNIRSHPYFRESLQALQRNILSSRPSRTSLSSLEAKQLEDASKEIGEISDPMKKSAFKAAMGRDPVTERDWSEAYHLAEQQLAGPRTALSNIVNDLSAQGKPVPGRYMKAAGMTQPNVPQHGLGDINSEQPVEVEMGAPKSGNVPQVPTVTSVEELKKLNLPPGTKFMTPDGKTRIAK